jgi:epoxyqueuosine reductase
MNPFSEDLLKSLHVLDWGYTEEAIPTSFKQYDTWVKDKLHGPLSYLSDHRKDLRQDLRHVFPQFQSAVVFLFSYQETKKWMLENNQHAVASYALGFEGEDYHYALKKRLQILGDEIRKTHPELQFTFSLDIQPVLERDLAFRAGLGWFGKNSMLISRKEGSYFIIGSLLLNEKLTVETKITDVDHCGTCTACAVACPTDAIDLETRTIIASQCISTYTIETFKDVPAPAGFEKSRGEVFGCDICQDVCPWNKKSLMNVVAELNIKDSFSYLKELLLIQKKTDLKTFIEGTTNRGFKKHFQGTVFDRPGKEGWLKNLKAFFTSNRSDS